MPRTTSKRPAKPALLPATPTLRMASYRQRMREAGLRPVQIWVPDTRAPDFAAICNRQALAVALHDPAGDDLLRFAEGMADWPDA
jgi:hypothetical protein